MNQSISAIIFDLGGVVLNLDYEKTIKAFEKIGGKDFKSRYSQAKQGMVFDQFETGKISPDEFRRALLEMLPNETTPEQVDIAWNSMLLDLPAERITLLNRLKDKYKIYLFSNTNAIHLASFRNSIEKEHGTPELLEKTFHKTYYSHEVGLRKPNIEAFQFVLDDQNLDPKSVVFVDDSEQHVIGARKLGINAIHLTDQNILEIFKDY